MIDTINTVEPTSGTRFAVDAVTRGTTPLPEVAYADALAGTVGTALEAYSRATKPLVLPNPAIHAETVHGFIHAVNVAYDRHYPLTLSPDMIWLLIVQGFALYVNNNSESLRRLFVAHDGVAPIVVNRDEFVRGFAGNDWEGVFAEFSQQIRTHIGAETHRHIIPPFSTTGAVEKAAFEVTLMEAMQQYFHYSVVSFCGIPEITLEGTAADWQALRAGGASLLSRTMPGWYAQVAPVLEAFAQAAQGSVDRGFWKDFYKRKDESGGALITGHVSRLFPYLIWDKKPIYRYRDPQGDKARAADSDGFGSARVPSGLSVAPFTWQHRRTPLAMEFVAGFVGAAQDAETLAVRPEIGWAVRRRD